MAAQASLFESDFKKSVGILGTLSLNEDIQIPALCLQAIASLYDGLESTQVRTIKSIQSLADGRNLSGTECLYVGLAFMWAEPYDSIEYLKKAESKGVRGAVLRLLRTHAYGNASLDADGKDEAKEYVALALENAKLARADMPENQLAILREFVANLNALIIYRRLGLDHREFHDSAERLLKLLSTDHGSNNGAMYQYLEETEGDIQALTFVHNLQEHQLVDYLRIDRMFTGLHVPDEFAYSIEADAGRLEHHGEYRAPVKQIVQLLSGATLDERKFILHAYSNTVQQRMSREAFDTLEFSWATAKLLEADPHLGPSGLVAQNVEKAKRCIEDFSGTYIADIYQPMVDIETMTPEAVIARSRYSRRRLSVACFVAGIHALANGKKASEAQAYFQECVDEGFCVFYTYKFSRAMVKRLAGENEAYYWCIE